MAGNSFVHNIILNGTDRTKGAFGSIDRSIKRLAGGLAGILSINALKNLGQDALESAEKVGRLSTRLGVSVQELSQFQYVGEQSGIAVNTLNMALQRQIRRLGEVANTGKGEAIPALEGLGLSAKKLSALPLGDQMEILADRFSQIGDRGERLRIAFKLWDSEGVAMLQAMENGAEGVRKLREESDKLGRTLSQDQVDAAIAASDAMGRLKGAIEGAVTTIAVRAAPVITGLANFLQNKLPSAIQFTARAFHLFQQIALSVAITILEAYESLEETLDKVLDFFERQLRKWDDFVANFAGGAFDIAQSSETMEDAFDGSAEMLDILRGRLAQSKQAVDDMKGSTQDVAVTMGEELVPAADAMGGALEGICDKAKKVSDCGQKTSKDLTDAFVGPPVEIKEEWERMTDDIVAGFGGLLGRLNPVLGELVNTFGRHFQQIVDKLPAGVRDSLTGAIAGGTAGFGLGGALFGGSGAVGGAIGGALGSIIPGIGSAIGSLVGSVLGGIFGDKDNPESNIFFGEFLPGRFHRGLKPNDMSFGFGGLPVTVGAGVDNFSQVQGQVFQTVETFFDAIAGVLTSDQQGALAGLLEGRRFNIEPETLGQTLDQLSEFVVQVLDPVAQNLVRATGAQGYEDVLDTIAAVIDMNNQLDADVVTAFNDALANAPGSMLESVYQASDALGTAVDAYDGTIDSIRGITDAARGFNEIVLQTLAAIEQARVVIGQTTENSVFGLQQRQAALGGKESEFNFLNAEIERLVALIPTLTDPETIANTIARINQLSGQATNIAGQLLTPEEFATFITEQIKFLQDVQELGNERLDEIATEIGNHYEETMRQEREAIAAAAADLAAASAAMGQHVGRFGGSVGQFGAIAATGFTLDINVNQSAAPNPVGA